MLRPNIIGALLYFTSNLLLRFRPLTLKPIDDPVEPSQRTSDSPHGDPTRRKKPDSLRFRQKREDGIGVEPIAGVAEFDPDYVGISIVL
jgi:hypothetical protein